MALGLQPLPPAPYLEQATRNIRRLSVERDRLVALSNDLRVRALVLNFYVINYFHVEALLYSIAGYLHSVLGQTGAGCSRPSLFTAILFWAASRKHSLHCSVYAGTLIFPAK